MNQQTMDVHHIPHSRFRQQPLLLLLLLLSILSSGHSFELTPAPSRSPTTTTTTTPVHDVSSTSLSRRAYFQQSQLQLLFPIVTGTISFATTLFSVIVPSSNAAVLQNSQTNVFEVGKDLTVEQALERFQQGQESLQYLLDHYDAICQTADSGDNVRRYLGTVGLTSGLYGISKVLKILQQNQEEGTIEDIVAFSELAEELMASINQADGSAYMAIFTTSSTSGVPSQRYFDDAKVEIERAVTTMQALSQQLHLLPTSKK